MKEPIQGLWEVYLTEYPDEGSALIEAPDATEAIRIARHTDPEACGGPWEGEPADALTAEAMTPAAMATRIANGEADASGTIEGQWLATVACGQAMEIERLRGMLRRAARLAKHTNAALGAHGPCRNNSCSECGLTFDEAGALLRDLRMEGLDR